MDGALARNRNGTANTPEPYPRGNRFAFRYRFWLKMTRDFGQKAVNRAGEQFPCEWFEQIFICACFKCTGSVDPVIATSDDDDLGWLQFLANAAANLKAV